MPTIDFSSGYRDATKGATLKALQKRQDDQAAATALAMKPREIGSMWQGAAQIGDVISGSIREGRLANQEAAGRARFAELLAGGLAPDEVGEAMGLDPETTMKWQERNWAQEDLTEQRKTEEMRLLRERGWTVEDAEKRVREKIAEEDRAAGRETTIDTRELGQTIDQEKRAAAAKIEEEKRAAAAKIEEEKRAAAQEGIVDTRELGQTIEGEKRKTEAEVAAIGEKTEARKAEWLKLNPNGDINSPEAQSYILRDAAEPTGGFLGPQGIKAVQEFKEQANVLTTGLNDINEAKALVPLALTGDIGRKIADTASMGGEQGIQAAVYLSEKLGYPITREGIQATVRLYQIMDNVATTRMSGTLKGQTSNLEMDKFTKIFAAPGATPEAKLQALISLEQAFAQDRNAVSATLQGSVGEGLPEYKYIPVTGGMTPSADAAAPAAAEGGATPAPVPAMEPGDEEGDTGSDEHGKLKVVGGKWTRIP